MPKLGKHSFTVTGPACDATAESAELGVSFAINRGNRAAMKHTEATFYVRDRGGEVFGRIEAYSDGSVNIYTKERGNV